MQGADAESVGREALFCTGRGSGGAQTAPLTSSIVRFTSRDSHTPSLCLSQPKARANTGHTQWKRNQRAQTYRQRQKYGRRENSPQGFPSFGAGFLSSPIGLLLGWCVCFSCWCAVILGGVSVLGDEVSPVLGVFSCIAFVFFARVCV